MKQIFDDIPVLLLLLASILTGCASPAREAHPDFAPVYQPVTVNTEKNDGAIFTSGTEIALFEDIKAKRVGDILTIMLVEQTSGQNSSDTSLSQSTGMNVSAPTVGGSTRTNLGVDLNSDRSFTGETGSSQSNRLSGSITVTVSDVLPGGNLIVQGEKWIQINRGSELIRLKGIVRPRDINPDNTLLSTQVADARISYKGTGTEKDANVMGWAARIVFSSLWPF